MNDQVITVSMLLTLEPPRRRPPPRSWRDSRRILEVHRPLRPPSSLCSGKSRSLGPQRSEGVSEVVFAMYFTFSKIMSRAMWLLLVSPTKVIMRSGCFTSPFLLKSKLVWLNFLFFSCNNIWVYLMRILAPLRCFISSTDSPPLPITIPMVEFGTTNLIVLGTGWADIQNTAWPVSLRVALSQLVQTLLHLLHQHLKNCWLSGTCEVASDLTHFLWFTSGPIWTMEQKGGANHYKFKLKKKISCIMVKSYDDNVAHFMIYPKQISYLCHIRNGLLWSSN